MLGLERMLREGWPGSWACVPSEWWSGLAGSAAAVALAAATAQSVDGFETEPLDVPQATRRADDLRNLVNQSHTRSGYVERGRACSLPDWRWERFVCTI